MRMEALDDASSFPDTALPQTFATHSQHILDAAILHFKTVPDSDCVCVAGGELDFVEFADAITANPEQESYAKRLIDQRVEELKTFTLLLDADGSGCVSLEELGSFERKPCRPDVPAFDLAFVHWQAILCIGWVAGRCPRS